MAKRQRVRMAWQPVWTSEIEKWTRYQLQIHLFNCSKSTTIKDNAIGIDDLLQEAKIVFLKLTKTYCIVANEAHFFCLYRTSLSRFLIDRVRAKHRRPSEYLVDDNPAQDRVGEVTNAGHLKILIEQMPDELKLVLKALTAGRIRLKLNRPTASLRTRENLNTRLRRQLALTSADPVGDLKRYLLNQ